MSINIPKRFFIVMMMVDLVVLSGYYDNLDTLHFVSAIVSYLLCGILLLCKIKQENK